ncbi:MAG: 2-dehydropantoate 2-reductase [Burkholderiaceae bacterium]|nr:2-dehydropantoate 2-reductase [Burkholderiaceae bacterium]
MRICVVGAGAIGGLLGARLAKAGEEVTLVARGPQLEALKNNGLRFIEEDGSEWAVQPKAVGNIREAGPQDLIVLGMKAHQVAAVVDDLAAAYTDDTMVLTAQNGIPYWYFMKQAGVHQGRVIESVDPGGVVARGIPIDRVIGSVVYPAAEMIAPGVLKHIEGNRFSISEVDGADTPRVRQLSETLRNAGFKAPVTSDIRSEIWTKLWGNLSFNPISALTHATLVDICQFPMTRDLAAKMMAEAQQVGEALGIAFRVSLEKRIAGAEAVGKHKTSMLQDIELGRAPEIAALVGSIIELGAVAGVPTPHIQAVYALVSLLAKTLADEKGKLKITQ